MYKKTETFESVDKANTLLMGDANCPKIIDFRAGLYPPQYYPHTFEKPRIKRFFSYKEFLPPKKQNGAECRKKMNFQVCLQSEYFILEVPAAHENISLVAVFISPVRIYSYSGRSFARKNLTQTIYFCRHPNIYCRLLKKSI